MRRRAAWTAALFALLLVARLLLPALPAVPGGTSEWSAGAGLPAWDVSALCLSGGKPAPDGPLDGHRQAHCPLCSPPDALPALGAIEPSLQVAQSGERGWVPAASELAAHSRAERHAARAPPVLS
jgi:hypothetical protein